MKSAIGLRFLGGVLLAAMALLLNGTAQAQLTYGVRAGVGFPTLRRTFVDRSERTANIVGFHAGAEAAYFFTSSPGLYLESGLQLALLGGASLNVNWFLPGTTRYNSRMQLYALQLPLRLGYATALGSLSLYISMGLQPSVALWGEVDQIVDGQRHQARASFESEFNRFDVAISFHTGVGFGRLPLFFGIYVDYGLIGIQAANGEGHIGNFGLSLAYLFRRPAMLSADAPSMARVKNGNDPQ